ncbi:hypothetical protein B0T21DRAFT_371436 [Apiosordaria backusii]|uniref:Uncharacterized protein n=1 Tax=Apiosordaria backusii TaxID=314023 RepID=A0AA40B2A9_9PEZI|nr:hypothetical protein B0T21DRAFT_371436 [Apiosordaria backusii]
MALAKRPKPITLSSDGRTSSDSDKSSVGAHTDINDDPAAAKKTFVSPPRPIYRRRYGARDENAGKQNWKIIGFGNYDAKDLDTGTKEEDDFLAMRAEIEAMIRHMRPSSTGPSPVVTISGYKLRRRDSAHTEFFNAVVITSNSPSFATEVKKLIQKSGILSDPEGQDFKLVVQDAPPKYDGADVSEEVPGTGPQPVMTATEPNGSRRSLSRSGLACVLGGNMGRPQTPVEDPEAQKGKRLEKKHTRSN